MGYDLAILDARVYDGAGAPARRADVGVRVDTASAQAFLLAMIALNP